jgi:hypothetical protein
VRQNGRDTNPLIEAFCQWLRMEVSGPTSTFPVVP